MLLARYERTGYCFVHIPKNGGTTVEREIYQHKVGHRTWAELHRMAPLQYPRWFKFCVIREPVDRFLSSYDYLARGGRNPIDEEIGRRFVRRYAPNEFVAKFENDAVFQNQIMRYFHFRPQADYVMSDDGHCMVDRLFSFDRLGEELAGLLGIEPAAVGHHNKTSGTRTSASVLTVRSRRLIESLYARDVLLYETCRATPSNVYLERLDPSGAASTAGLAC